MNKIEDFKLKVNQFHIVAVTETWASENVTDAELSVDGYQLFRKDRVDRSGGGVLLYVAENLTAVSHEKLNKFEVESMWCTLHLSKCKLLVGVCYRSPTSSQQYNEDLLLMLEAAANDKASDHVLLMGDFNYPEINYQDYMVKAAVDSDPYKFFMKTQDLFLEQNVLDCTRFRDGDRPSQLDWIFTDEDNLIDNIEYTAPIGKSDHVCLTWNYRCEVSSEINVSRKLNFWRGDYDSIRKELAGVNWRDSLATLETDSAWLFLKWKLQEVTNRFVPAKKPINKKKNDWITKGTIRSIKEREQCWCKFRNCRTEKNCRLYKEKRNRVVTELRRDKQDFIKKLIASFKVKPKKFYGYIRQLQSIKTAVEKLKKEDGSLTTSARESAEHLCQFFQSVFVNEDMTNMSGMDQDKQTDISLNIQFDEDAVRCKLLKLIPDKSMGPDGLHPKLLKECAEELALPLSIVFTKSYAEGVVPWDWKSAEITPIFKKGSKNDANNYRPVSLTSIICKIMESIIKDAVLEHVENSHLVSDNQHGFTRRRSCLTNLLETFEAWTRLLDAGLGIDVIYLDYRKAFDTVPHRRLLLKLASYGFGSNLINWIRSFLLNRRMRVIVDGEASDWVDVMSGVPQGSVLGPLLFILFVNDLPQWIMSDMKMFADDTKMWHEIKNCDDAQALQNDLNRLTEWSKLWLLEFNSDKCKVMHLGHRLDTDYFLTKGTQTHKLDSTEDERDLGIMVSSDMKTSKQCAKSAAKAMSVLGLIKRHFSNLQAEEFRILYKTYVRPHMEYCVQAWSPHLKKDINCLETVQRRATKLVPSIAKYDYETRLKLLNLPSLEKRRLRGDLIETFKIITGRENVKLEDFFELATTDRTLRGHRYKLFVKRCNTTLRQNFFSQRVVNAWNSLPNEVVEATSVNCFKNRLDKLGFNTGGLSHEDDQFG